MKELYRRLMESADTTPAVFDMDWNTAKPGLVYDRDHNTQTDLKAILKDSVDNTLIVMIGAAQHLFMAVPVFSNYAISFIPHFISKIGRADHDAEQIAAQTGRQKAVLDYLGFADLSSLVAAADMPNPRAVAFGMMEVPCHTTGGPRQKDFEILYRVAGNAEKYGIKRVLLISEDIHVGGMKDAVLRGGIMESYSVSFLRYCAQSKLDVCIAAFGHEQFQVPQSVGSVECPIETYLARKPEIGSFFTRRGKNE